VAGWRLWTEFEDGRMNKWRVKLKARPRVDGASRESPSSAFL
jgi:hypothetical protein